MARPTQHRTITKRVRLTAAEAARLASDAGEATKGDESAFIRLRLSDGPPLVTGKGMARAELRECLRLVTTLQSKLKGMDHDADRALQRLAEITFEALHDDH